MDLAEQDKLSSAQIGRLNGIAPSTVRVYQMRARRTLKSPPTRPPAPKAASSPTPRRTATDFTGMDVSAAALNQLPQRQRQVVRMHLAGAQPAEIAIELSMAKATVRVHLHRAMKTLQTNTTPAPPGRRRSRRTPSLCGRHAQRGETKR
ncbi:sigma-70 region 4 domain-containing protein [Catellatospora chokoriensis]